MGVDAEVLYPGPSDAEFERRYTAIRARMATEGLDALLVYGDSSSDGANHANVVYLTGYEDPWFAYVLLLPEGPPVLLNSNPLYLPHARTVAHTDVVEAIGWNPGRGAADALQDAGVAGGRIGLTGARGIHTSTPPYAHYLELTAALPAATFVDGTDILSDVRRIKSAEEIDLLRAGARITDATIEAIATEAAPGMTEHDLAGIIHRTAGAHAGVQRLVFVGSTPMGAPELVFPRQQPSARRLREGDVVLTELSTSHGGYAGQIHRPFTVAAEPDADYRMLFEVGVEAYHAVLGAIGPGNTDDDLRAAARPVFEAAGVHTIDALLHGWGLSIEPPRLDVPEVATIERPQMSVTFEPGMTLVVQPHVVTPDGRRGLQVGSLAVVTPDGTEALQQAPLEFRTLA